MNNSIYTNSNRILLILVLCTFGLACVHQQQVAVQKEVTKAAVVKQADVNKIYSVAAKKDQKFASGEIDSTIKNNIEAKLQKYTKQQDSISVAIAYLERASKDKSLYKNNKTYVTSQMKLLKTFKDSYKARLRRIAMIDTSLDWTTSHSFNLAAFFGPGKYEIPSDKMKAAETAFIPILDSLVQFYNRYQDIEREATLIIMGFADEVGFTPGTETYKEIATLVNQPQPSKPLMNQKLSEMRANKLGDVMERLLARKINGFDSVRNVDFVFLETGKGEALPSRLIKDYKPEDERRRVVLFFWNILPK
jgi:outer membrane protein OmpA-like peptidoglycan-associated protein